MTTVSISKFCAQYRRLLQRARRTGEPLLLTRRGRPVARVTPEGPPRAKPLRSLLGIAKGRIRILGDISGPAIDPGDWHCLKE